MHSSLLTVFATTLSLKRTSTTSPCLRAAPRRSLNSNLLTGEIPTEIGQLVGLNGLQVSDAQSLPHLLVVTLTLLGERRIAACFVAKSIRVLFLLCDR